MDHRTKPGTPLDLLAHYGTKGMQWGVRKARPTGRQILSARKRQEGRRDAFARAPKNSRAAAKAKKEFLTNEDRVTGKHMLLGEKWAVAFVGGPLGLAYALHNPRSVQKTAAKVDAARK